MDLPSAEGWMPFFWPWPCSGPLAGFDIRGSTSPPPPSWTRLRTQPPPKGARRVPRTPPTDQKFRSGALHRKFWNFLEIFFGIFGRFGGGVLCSARQEGGSNSLNLSSSNLPLPAPPRPHSKQQTPSQHHNVSQTRMICFLGIVWKHFILPHSLQTCSMIASPVWVCCLTLWWISSPQWLLHSDILKCVSVPVRVQMHVRARVWSHVFFALHQAKLDTNNVCLVRFAVFLCSGASLHTFPLTHSE